MKVVEAMYYIGYAVSRQYRLARRRRLDCPVISVGNITLGGTGKTPAVIAIAEEAVRRKYRPCILTRGYKGTVKKPAFVSKGDGTLLKPEEAGDEAVLMAKRLQGVEIIKSADRYRGALLSNNANLFIIDDGYQHRRLERDRDILLIDRLNPFGNGRLFPAGTLREPLREMRRADTIVITRSGPDPEFAETLRRYNPEAQYFFSAVRPTWLIRQNGDFLPAESLRGKRVYAFCGIGNPGGFAHTLLTFGSTLVGFKSFADHQVYEGAGLETMYQEAMRVMADMIVTTEKDFVKLSSFILPDTVAALRVEFDISRDFYDSIFAFGNQSGEDDSGGS